MAALTETQSDRTSLGPPARTDLQTRRHTDTDGAVSPAHGPLIIRLSQQYEAAYIREESCSLFRAQSADGESQFRSK
ncbi:hypothetical protein EYF80_031841 [Liparis tanakae]|uniref:Uncharacterized protein n=1 Tax=Liparis tanakae TaxID=230148 RepID=A0A4Z2GXU1_9TELE|nr:hypothetical protein EYF80_031841 [Liparis tanakae]